MEEHYSDMSSLGAKSRVVVKKKVAKKYVKNTRLGFSRQFILSQILLFFTSKGTKSTKKQTKGFPDGRTDVQNWP